MWCTFVVDGDGDGSRSGSCLGIVDGGGLLHPLRGLASVQFSHLGDKGCLLIEMLRRPSLGVDLPRCGLTLVSPPGRLAAGLKGVPFLAEALLSVL
jgi:hypothetical protein